MENNWIDIFGVEKFDLIIGNPPYVNTHDMNKTTISFLKNNFNTTKNGVFNIFYAFIEHGLKQMSNDGYLEFIVPNNFLTIKSAEKLRELLQANANVCSLIDFSDNMIFKPVRTYNCIIKLSNTPQHELLYSVMCKTDDIKSDLSKLSFNHMDIGKLDKNGWILVDEHTLQNICQIESQETPIKDFVRTGIATLRDGVYFANCDKNGYYKNIGGKRFPIEDEMIKPIYKIPDLKDCDDAKEVVQYIIFPYVKGKNGFELIDESVFKNKYPNTYSYLYEMKSILDERDKGKANSGAWYAYGRTQGLNKYGKKIMFPTFSNHPKFILIDDEDALFCNGYAVFENDKIPLSLLIKVLNSKVMEYYVSNTSYSIEGGYYCYQKKYIERFSIPTFNESEVSILMTGSKDDIDNMLINKYQLI